MGSIRQIAVIIFTSIICCAYVVADAQTLPAAEIFKINGLIGKYIHKNYKPDSTSLANFCEAGFLLVKFTVDSNRQVANLSFSKKAPLFIQKALTIAIKYIETDIYLTDKMMRSGKVFILPFQYSYQLGCHFDKIPAGKDFYKTYFDKWTDMEHYDDRLIQAMEMTDGTYYGLDGVLLNVFSTGAVSGY